MDFENYKLAFENHLGIKQSANQHEEALFERANKYIGKITWIPGLRMVAVVNSLSMYATHDDSDIDLFIVTEKNRMWLARILITGIFWCYGVWRHNDDIAGNFCLSFWAEETALNLSKIAIENDVYLYFWAYYMKPIILDDSIWKDLEKANSAQKFSKDYDNYVTLKVQQRKQANISTKLLDIANKMARYFGEKRSRNTYEKKGRPEGIIIAGDMLKFHDQDRRREIRDELLSQTK